MIAVVALENGVGLVTTGEHAAGEVIAPAVIAQDRVTGHRSPPSPPLTPHPLVQRLRKRFLVRGFQGEALSHAALITSHDDTAKLNLLARFRSMGTALLACRMTC